MFVEALAEDSAVWEILGVREVSFIDNDPASIRLEFFCFSGNNSGGSAKRMVKSFSLPFIALMKVRPGSLWQNGQKISINPRLRQTRYIFPKKSKLVICRKHLTTEQIKAKVSRSKNPHRSFMAFTNYVLCRGSHFTVRIPCAELIRHFLCPTQGFAKKMISGQFDTYTDPAHPTLPVVGLTSRVSEAVARLLSTHEGRRAARFPHKMLKLCRIAAAMNRDHSPLLLHALFPTTNKVRIDMALTCGDIINTLAIQLHHNTKVLN